MAPEGTANPQRWAELATPDERPSWDYNTDRETDLRKIAMIYVRNVLPVFSSRSFVVPCLSCLMFKSLSHFELSFVYGVRVF